MKYILKCYCSKEVKHLKKELKNAYEMQQYLLLFIKKDARFDYHQNEQSETISVVVGSEIEWLWLLEQSEKILKRSYFTINTNSH